MSGRIPGKICDKEVAPIWEMAWFEFSSAISAQPSVFSLRFITTASGKNREDAEDFTEGR
jgi:hypothetical protein